MNEEEKLAIRLGKIHGQMLGELERLDNPPKRLLRLIPDRQAYEAAAPAREERRSAIVEALPHLAYVVKMLNPDWDDTAAKPIRPREANRGIPPQGVAGTAMDIIKETTWPLTIAEIVDLLGERFGYDLSTVAERQRYHTAVSNGLMHTYREDLVEHPGSPTRWSWRMGDEAD